MADFLDKAKDVAKDLTGKARATVSDNADRIDGAVDKAAGFVDEKTKRKYSDKIEKAQGAAHRAVGKIGGEEGGGGGAGGPADA